MGLRVFVWVWGLSGLGGVYRVKGFSAQQYRKNTPT